MLTTKQKVAIVKIENVIDDIRALENYQQGISIKNISTHNLQHMKSKLLLLKYIVNQL